MENSNERSDEQRPGSVPDGRIRLRFVADDRSLRRYQQRLDWIPGHGWYGDPLGDLVPIRARKRARQQGHGPARARRHHQWNWHDRLHPTRHRPAVRDVELGSRLARHDGRVCHDRKRHPLQGALPCDQDPGSMPGLRGGSGTDVWSVMG